MHVACDVLCIFMHSTYTMYGTFPPCIQFLGQNIYYTPLCASTNTLAMQRLHTEQLPEGTVVITNYQYKGRGQRGNRWHSEPYKNLTFSVVLRPTFLVVQQQFALNILTALSLYQVLGTYIPSGLYIKWPNDIYYQHKKLSGVLIDNIISKQHIKTAVIGIGLNVNQVRFCTTIKRATSLADICGYSFDLKYVLHQLLATLERNYIQLRDQGLAILRATYLKHMYWIHEVHTFRDVNRARTFSGTIKGLDTIGNLIIEHTDGYLSYYRPQQVTFVT